MHRQLGFALPGLMICHGKINRLILNDNKFTQIGARLGRIDNAFIVAIHGALCYVPRAMLAFARAKCMLAGAAGACV